jgi:hypothetical protein
VTPAARFHEKERPGIPVFDFLRLFFGIISPLYRENECSISLRVLVPLIFIPLSFNCIKLIGLNQLRVFGR